MTQTSLQTFITRHGVRLEVLGAIVENAGECVVVWPCMGGAVQMYRVPVEKFAARGCSCILYNPCGHGNSEGEMEIPAALGALEEILRAYVPAETPIVMVGHSAGANACLQFGARHREPERFVLVAPVLDSRESLFFMYQRRTIAEFIDILCAYAEDDTEVRRVLADEKWLDGDVWRSNGHRKLLDEIPSRTHIGSFLENLFHPGHNSFGELEKFAGRTNIFTAPIDTWYPAETTLGLAKKYSIPIQTIPEARNHFFMGGWELVWSEVLRIVFGK